MCLVCHIFPYFKENPPSVFILTNNTTKPDCYIYKFSHFPLCLLVIIMGDERIYKKQFCVGLATGFYLGMNYLSVRLFLQSRYIIPVHLSFSLSFSVSLSLSLSLPLLYCSITYLPYEDFPFISALMVVFRVNVKVVLKVIIKHNFSSFHP